MISFQEEKEEEEKEKEKDHCSFFLSSIKEHWISREIFSSVNIFIVIYRNIRLKLFRKILNDTISKLRRMLIDEEASILYIKIQLHWSDEEESKRWRSISFSIGRIFSLSLLEDVHSIA